MKLFKFISILCFALASFAFSQAAGGDVPLFSLSSSSMSDENGTSMKFSITQQDELGTPSETGCSVDLDWKRLAECITREVGISAGSASSNAVELETSLNLGGFDAATGKCVYELEPLTFGGMIPNFNGNGHTITGFCYIAEGNFGDDAVHAGFFGDMRNSNHLDVQNVTFVDAHVAVSGNAENFYAGVVVAQAGVFVTLKNVKVATSTVMYAPTQSALAAAGNSNVYLGGLLGASSGFWGSQTLEITDSEFSGNVQSRCGMNTYMGGVAGLLQVGDGLDVSRLAVSASILNNSSANLCGETYEFSGANVGGLLGGVESEDTIYMTMEGNSVVGTVASVQEESSVGYLIGSEAVSNYGYNYVWSNYFYDLGQAPAESKKPLIGIASRNEAEWSKGDYMVKNNFRNALDELTVTGSFDYNGDGALVMEDASRMKNGIVSSQTMKTPVFAAQLNSSNVLWSLNSDANDGLPFRIDDENLAIVAVTFLFTDVYKSLSNEDVESLKNIGMNVSFTDDLLSEASLMLLTDNKGYLPTESIEVLKGLSTELYYVDDEKRFYLDSPVYENVNVNVNTPKTYSVKYLLDNYDAGTSVSAGERGLFDEYMEEFEKIADYNPMFLRTNITTFSTDQVDLLFPKVVLLPKDDAKPILPLGFVKACVTKNKAPACLEGSVTSFTNDDPIYKMTTWLEGIDADDNTVYLVYTKESAYTKGMFESKEIPVVIKSFGESIDGKTTEVEKFELWEGNKFIKSDVFYAAKFLPEAPAGYRLNSYTVNVRLTDGADADPIVVDDNNFGTVKKLVSDIQREELKNPSRYNVSWQVTLDASDTVNLENLIRAAVVTGGRTYQNSFMMSKSVSITPELEPIPFKIDFNLGTQTEKVFLLGNWDEEYYEFDENGEAELPMLASTAACFDGWTKSKDEQERWHFVNGNLLSNLNVVDDAFALYGSWIPVGSEVCSSISTRALTLKADEDPNMVNGSISLWQSYKRPTGEDVILEHSYTNGLLFVPETSDPIKFHVSTKPAEGYKLARLILKDWDVNEDESEENVEGEIIPLNENDTTFTTVFEEYHGYSLNAVFKPYIDVTLDLNTSSDKVLYGENSRMKKVSVMDIDDEVVLPSWIYTADSCVLGWSVKPDAMDYEYRSMTYSDEIYRNVGEDHKLYAVWGNREQCVGQGGYDILWLDAEKDYLQFEETLTEGDSELVQMHRFSANGTMILPRHTNGHSFVLRSIPGSEFVVDSVLFVRKGSGESAVFARDENFSFYYLYDGVFTPYYSVAKDTVPEDTIPDIELPSDSGSVVIGTPAMAMNGAAAQVKVPTDLKKDQEFEVYVVVINAAGDTIKETAQSGVVKNAPHVAEVMVYPLPAGKYNVVVSVRSENGVAYKKTQLVVDPIVIATKKDEWQMVSLAAVDMDAISWDGDELFYWWDENANYGDFWQYQKLTRLGDVENTRGYWYNSLEGRQLPLMSISESVPEAEWKLDSVYSGWNMVANPYGWRVNVPDSLEVAVWDDEISNYAYPNTLEPYQAAWVYVNAPQEVALKDTPVFAMDSAAGIAAKRRALAKARNAGDWTIRAELSDVSGHKDAWNVLGVGEAAVMPEPPMGMGNLVNLAVLDEKRRLAKFVKAAPASADNVADFEWRLELSATSDRMGFLSFDGLEQVAALGYHLYVTVDGKTAEVKPGEKLRVALKAQGSVATVRVSTQKAVTLASALDGLRLNQSAGSLNVTFNVSEGLAGSRMIVEVVDLQGKIVARDIATSKAGSNMVMLQAPKSGIYVVRTRVGKHQLVGKVLVK